MIVELTLHPLFAKKEDAMIHPPFIRHLCVLGAALMLAACGGEADGSFENFPARAQTLLTARAATLTAAADTPAGTPATISASSMQPPEQGLRAMAGFDNLGSTCYANAALKFLIHSIGPQRLTQHLQAFAADGDAQQREAAQGFMQLIADTCSETGPTRQQLSDFLAAVQQLPAFSAINADNALDFPIVGRQQDTDEFLTKLSQSFQLHTLYASEITLRGGLDTLRSEGQYWTILQPASPDDTLQAVLDRTPAADWQLLLQRPRPHLTVRLENAMHDAQGRHLLSNRNFDFNQPVRLHATEGNLTTVLTLEPREVIEFRGTHQSGHCVVYAKDAQWVRYDDDQVTALSQMPALEQVRFINFAITHIETASSSPAADAS